MNITPARDPRDAALQQAELLIKQRRLNDARRICEELLAAGDACVEACFLLGVIDAEQNRPAEALASFDRTLACAEITGGQAARVHAHRAKALIRLRRQEESRDSIASAVADAPEDALTLDTIGVVLSHLGEHARAVRFYEQAVTLAPGNANIAHNLGLARQFSGDFEGAEAAFRAELALRPNGPKPYVALVALRRQTPEANFIPQLTAQFAAAGSDAQARNELGHALAKTYEDMGEHAKALEWLLAAKQMKRAAVGDVIPSLAQVFAVADAPARAPARTPGDPSAQPVFIVGMPRTGTTLTDRILSSHAEVVSAGELGNFAALAHRLTGQASLEEGAVFARAGDIDWAALGRAYLDSVRPLGGGAARVIDKMPINFLYAAMIHRALPNARIICLRRNPMDACLSNFRQMFAHAASQYFYAYSMEQTARYYLLFDDLVARLRRLLPEDRFTEVRYEDLVQDLESEARRLVDFCGLAWDARCLSFHDNQAPSATASSVQVRAPLYASSIGRWKLYGEGLKPMEDILRQGGVSLE